MHRISKSIFRKLLPFFSPAFLHIFSFSKMAASDMILKLPEYIPLSVVDIVRLVNGYIRAKQNKHKISIPDDLINVLIRFAGGKDQWDITTMPLWTNILLSDQ
eukprot:128417_1